MDLLRRRVAERLAVASSPTGNTEVPRSVTSYSESNLRQYWMPDAVSVECYECSARFTTFRRKHHCRVCGQIFCSKCCSIFISGKYLRCSGTLRVCVYCYKYFSQQHQTLEGEGSPANGDLVLGASGNQGDISGGNGYMSSSPSASFLERRFPRRLSSLMGGTSSASTGNLCIDNTASVLHSPSSSTLSSNHIQTPNSANNLRKKSSMVRPNFLTRDDDIEQNGEEGFLRGDVCTPDPAELAEIDIPRPEIYLKDPQKLEKLYEQIVSPSSGIPLETRRYRMKLYNGCFTGNDIIEWLQARDSTTWRSQAMAFGQALLDAGYLEDLSLTNNAGSATQLNTMNTFDEKIPYRPIIKEPVNRGSEDEADVVSISYTGNSVAIPFDADGPDWLQQVDFPMEGSDYDTEAEWKPRVPKISTACWGPELPEFSGVKANARGKSTSTTNIDIDTPFVPGLDNLYLRHVEDYLTRLMRRERLSHKWTELIKTFCNKIIAKIDLEPVVDPDLKRVNMDIRDFVKIKRIPGGLMEDCSIVKGEVFSNRVIRVGMPLTLDNTNILLVKDSIAYAREDRYVSLANMKLQEEEYTKNICHKIKSFNPRLILVEKSVCRSAQDILCDANIAVVLNVKGKILKRVSRFFSTPIVESLGSMVERPTLGACDRYRSRMFNDISEGDSKNLISLEGRDLKNGCTILLRGGSGEELAKVKRVIRRILLIKIHCKYERSFLLHEDVQTDKLPEIKKVKFYEMTLSPFVSIPCDDLSLLDVGESDEGESDDYDQTGFNQNEHVSASSCLNLRIDQAKNDTPLCAFEKFVFTSGMEDVETRNLLAEYRAQCSSRVRSVKPKRTATKTKTEVPAYYRALEAKCTPMLFGSHATMTVNYCVPPWVVKMSFYHQNDIPLGVFLDSFCFAETYKCPSKKECSIPMRDHIRRFCLGEASVTLVLQTLEAPVVNTDVNSIFMWKFCNECKNMSSILPLSYNSWMLSFSMFLLLSLSETELVRRVGSDGSCPHSIHRDQFTCFAKGDLVAFFKVSPIIYSSLVFPPCKIVMPPLSSASDRLLRDFMDLSYKGSKLFSQINGKIVKLKAEGFLESYLSELEQEHNYDMSEYRLKADLIREKIELIDAGALLETQCSIAALSSSVYSSYIKWEGKLLQFQELKKKEEKLGKSEAKQRMSSGSMGANSSTSNLDRIGTSGDKSANGEKPTTGVGTEDNMSAPSRIWQSMLPSGPSEFQLNSPFGPTIHPSLCLPNRAVVVDEAQPSSIVAFALAKPEYAEFLSTRAKAESDSGSSSEISLSGVESSERQEQRHFKCQFSDETCKFYVKVQFAYEFAKLRERVLVKDDATIDFIASLSQCRHWISSGGKSGMTFYKTDDDRFIIKQMSSFENNSFQDFATHYFTYVAACQENGNQTLLAKILGVFTVGYKNSATGASLKIDVLVIENLFYKRNIHESYDLKGSVRNRLATAGDKPDDRSAMQVLMDENLLKVARERPFYVRKDKNPEFYSSINRDTHFLTKHSMMDYSLLVGIDTDTDDLVLGIIDYIRTFTWDKKLEMIIKSTGILGGRGKTPTIIYPKYYQKRFIEAMDTYFIQVPDYWYQFGASASISSEE